jgi:lipopolysaccharide/colanic/teichoic acid biosynthesis glycosyltransferase
MRAYDYMETYFPVSRGPHAHVPHRSALSHFKRLFDLLGSAVGMLLLTIVFIPIVIALKLDSPGPVFYSQTRCGLGGKLFKIHKFRSMVINAEALKSTVKNEAVGLIFKNKSDPRVTRIGQFLRKTSLDELPQFWNVFSGDMSLVGTRPPTLDEVKYYKPHHWQRLAVKPGITGEWQVYGRSSVENFEQIVQLDLRYQARWSVFYDLLLLVKTFKVVLFRQGAY